MYFDFEDYRPDIAPVGRAISWREGILISIIVHLAMIIVVLLAPRLFMPDAAAVARARALALAERQNQQPTFVFVSPKLDLAAPKPPDRGEASDKDRIAQAPERAPKPTNPLPYSRGNSPDRVEAEKRETPRGQGPAPNPAAGQRAPNAQPAPPDDSQKLADAKSMMQFQVPRPPTTPSGASGRGTIAH